MQAILDAIEEGTLDARIGLVLSDNPDAFILERAKKHGIETGVIDCRGFKTKFPEEAQAETAQRLKEAGVELVCLAGFLRLVKRPLLDAFPDRILNIHPALLPAFPGLESWKQALDAGAKEAGCTVKAWIPDRSSCRRACRFYPTIPRNPCMRGSRWSNTGSIRRQSRRWGGQCFEGFWLSPPSAGYVKFDSPYCWLSMMMTKITSSTPRMAKVIFTQLNGCSPAIFPVWPLTMT
jgi:hypothetical protein